MKKSFLLVATLGSIMSFAQEETMQRMDSIQTNETQLQAVEILGRLRKDYNSNYSFSASKIALKNMEITQAVSTVTKELLADRQAFRLGDVLKNVSGVSTVSFYNHYAIRGVTQSSAKRETRLVNGMKQTMVYYIQPLSSNVERVEVLKGPASMAFSNTDPGGSVNIITKKPLSEPRREVSITTGSFKTIRGALDLTGPLDKKKQFLYRFNVGYENSGSFRDIQFKKAYLISPSFSFVPNEKTNINIELVYNNDRSRLDMGQPIFGRNGTNTNLHSTPISTALGSTDDYYNMEQLTLMGSFTHRFTDDVAFNLSFLRDNWQEDVFEHRTSNFFAVDKQGKDIPTLVQMKAQRYIQKLYTDNVNAYFNTNFNLGSISNKMVFGYDAVRFEVAKDSEQNNAEGYIGADGTVKMTYDPNNPNDYLFIIRNGIEMPKPNVPHFDIANPNYSLGKTNEYVFNRVDMFPSVSYTTHGIYLQNQMEWNKFIFNFGLRQEWYIDYQNYKENNEKKTTQKKFLTRFGLMYKVIPNLNLYSSYVEGFMPQTDARIGREGSGGPFKPESSEMVEVGAKSEWLNRRLKINMALFNITQKNILMSANDPANPNLLVQRGKQRNKGFELDVIGAITPQWQMNLAYSYIDAKILEGTGYVAQKGDRKENTPKHTFNLWNRYDFKEGILKDFGVGLGFNYVSDKVAWYDRTLVIPEYTLMDVAAYYKIDKLQLSLNINNVFDKKYWLGAINYTRIFPGMPRNFMLNVRYNF